MSDEYPRIWLQLYGCDRDEYTDDEWETIEPQDEITWCQSQQYDTDVEYTRSDIASQDARDAARYRWLRKRVEVRNLEAMNGERRPGLEIRLGYTFMDTRHTDSNAEYVERCSAMVDAAIDAALAEQEGRDGVR